MLKYFLKPALSDFQIIQITNFEVENEFKHQLNFSLCTKNFTILKVNKLHDVTLIFREENKHLTKKLYYKSKTQKYHSFSSISTY